VATVTTKIGIADPRYVSSENDAAVLILPSSFHAPREAVPVSLVDGSLTPSVVGQLARIVGFGRTIVDRTSGDHIKHYGGDPVAHYDSNWIDFNAGINGEHECSGDSGGPALLNRGCGPVIIGIVHGHSDNACEVGTYQRIDIEQHFINHYVQAADPSYVPPPCNGIPPSNDGGGNPTPPDGGGDQADASSHGSSDGPPDGGPRPPDGTAGSDGGPSAASAPGGGCTVAVATRDSSTMWWRMLAGVLAALACARRKRA
jgi:hypothetical protein